MTTECSANPTMSLGQIAHARAFRRWSNLSLGKDVLVAVALLAGIGLVMSIGSSALDLMAWS